MKKSLLYKENNQIQNLINLPKINFNKATCFINKINFYNPLLRDAVTLLILF